MTFFLTITLQYWTKIVIKFITNCRHISNINNIITLVIIWEILLHFTTKKKKKTLLMLNL